ncbi:phage portal protein [Bacillus sp. MMSF_3328]|uniref:phage portal protein n=1 Tax=Bacillus sp. MMSF_3328 TaxID=3047080 RepID=UPI00273E5EF7|nr:phage portal protein [Bacillus sp. MMSF_3328]
MRTIGFLDAILKRNSELGFMFDGELIANIPLRIHMKKLAVETCAAFLGRTISQSEFRIKKGAEFEKDELYYRLNVRPNKNMTASTFWQTVILKLIYDNECLIIQADDQDLLIADDFLHNSYAVMEDTFSKVKVKEYEYKRSFRQSEVLHLRYTNEKLTPLIDGLFSDYGELFGRILNSQKRKSQIRGTVDMDMVAAKTPEQQGKLQEFINNMYKAVSGKDIAIIPQQKGFTYKEHFSGNTNGPGVDEINKVTNGFLDQVAMAIGIPVSLLHGDMADVEKQTKNYMMFTVSPLLKKIGDEGNSKFFTKKEYLSGNKLDIKSISYNSLFDLANSIDKLVSSGAFTGNEIRQEAGYEPSTDPNLEKHYITKNYTEMQTTEGGENG